MLNMVFFDNVQIFFELQISRTLIHLPAFLILKFLQILNSQKFKVKNCYAGMSSEVQDKLEGEICVR